MALAAPGGLFTEQGAAGRRVAAKQPEHSGKPAPESRGCGQVSRTHHPPFGDRGSAGGSGWDGEWAGKGRAGAAAVPGVAGVNPEEPISCPHQGTQAQPSATERGYFGSWQEVKSQGLCSRSEGSVGLWGPGGWGVTVAPARWAVRTRWLPHLPNMGEPPRTLHGKKSPCSAPGEVTWGTHGSVPLCPQPQDSYSWPLARTNSENPPVIQAPGL